MDRSRLYRIKKFLFVFISILMIATLIRVFFVKDAKRLSTSIFQLVQYCCFMIILISPRLIKKRLNISVPIEIHGTIAIFAFSALVLGDAFNFYHTFPWWDSLLHFFSGIILSFIALWIIKVIMNEKSKYIYMNRYFTALFVVTFSLALGAFWEICEFTCDGIFHTNSQQYMETTRGTLIGKKDVPLVGHEALRDTIKDLSLDLAGSLIVAIYGIVRYDHIAKIEKEMGEDDDRV